VKTEDHLSRLRWRITLIYALAMTIGLLGFGKFLLQSYLNTQRQEVSAELLLSANKAASAVAYGDDDFVDTEGYFEHDYEKEDPQLWIVAWDDNDESGYTVLAGPDESFFNVSLFEELDSVIEGVNHYMYALQDLDTGQLGAYARGVPITYYNGDTGRAAALAVTEPESVEFGYSDFRAKLILASLGLLVVSALAGYLVAGRSIEPARKSLQQQERLIADAAHELRTPVARILAVSESGIAGDEPAEEALHRVANVAASAAGLVDDLLVLARMDAGNEGLQIERFRLDLLVEAIADNFNNLTVHAIPTVMEGDPALIKRAVSNLVANAVAHGRVNDPDVRIQISVYPTQIVVADDGPGIDPEMLERVFERFQTGKQSGGHGLGLSIVQMIMEAHAGTVDIASGESGGAVFKLIFKRDDSSA